MTEPAPVPGVVEGGVPRQVGWWNERIGFHAAMDDPAVNRNPHPDCRPCIVFDPPPGKDANDGS